MADGPFRISNAKIQSFQRCRKQYWFSYLNGRRRPASPMNAAGITGTSVHRAMSVLTTTNYVDVALQELNAYLRMPAHELVGPGTEAYQTAFELFSRGCTAHEELCETAEDSWAELDTRAEWPSAGVSIRSRIDRVDRISDDRYRIVDWKTGNYDEEDETDLQLDIAHVGLRVCRGLSTDATVEAIGWNLRLERKRVRELVREDASATMKKLHAFAKSMYEAKEFEATPNSMCAYCDWFDECDEGQNRNWGEPPPD